MRLGVQAAVVDGALVLGDVAVDDGVVTAVGLPGGATGHIATPGFIDLQINGFAGVDFMGADASGYARAGDALLACGTTTFQPTFVSAPEADLLAALAAVPRHSIGPRVLGAHVEGPFLSTQRAGAHDSSDLRLPDTNLVKRLLDAGPLVQMTIAPELPGALEVIDLLVARGVRVSAGHSDATAAQAHLAFDHGVGTVTHLFNAMRPSSARDPGLALAALARDDVVVQAIVDGHHLAPDTVMAAWRAARGRFALVTDAVAAAGVGDGEFLLGGRPVVAKAGVVRTPDGQLAGSVSTMLDVVRNLHAQGISLQDAVAAATVIPARLAGRPDLGRLVPGAPADVVVLDDRLEIREVLAGPPSGSGLPSAGGLPSASRPKSGHP